MKSPFRYTGLIAVCLLLGVSWACAADPDPAGAAGNTTGAPAAKNPTAKAATDKNKLGDTAIANGQFRFDAPSADEWDAVKPDPADDKILYVNKAHTGKMQLVILPKDASVDHDIVGSVAAAMIKELNNQRTQQKCEMLLGPKVEKDKRFDIVIHEKFKYQEYPQDQLHLYKAVGPRVLMMTVSSVDKDDDKTSAILEAGKTLLDQVKFDRKMFRRN